MELETVKIKNPAEEGGYIIINKTDFDEKSNELFDAAPQGEAKLSDGLKVDAIKAELEKRGIAIPDGMTKKADLAALLDAAPQGE